jgi:hypothetical protein
LRCEVDTSKIDHLCWSQGGLALSLGTPTFFINGRKVVGAFPYNEMSRIVEEELAKVSRR